MRGFGLSQEEPTARRGAAHEADEQQWTYRPLEVLGKGSFGIVALAEVVETGERVAIKRVVYDPHRTSRELILLQKIRQSTDPMAVAGVASMPPHPHVVELRTHYFTTDPATGGRFLNLVMNYLPFNLHDLEKALQHERQWGLSHSPITATLEGCAGAEHDRVDSCDDETHEKAAHHATRVDQQERHRHPRLRLLLVKVVLFQLARGLAWLHHLHICHRDVKPGNILFDPATLQVQLCDLGSAKEIVNKQGERNVFYICSRYYRAPELLFGALHYGCEVDVWSLGCIAAELLRDVGKPLFRGSTTVDQMSEIFKVLGAPSQAEMEEMSPQGAKAMALSYQHVGADPFSSLPVQGDNVSAAPAPTTAGATSQTASHGTQPTTGPPSPSPPPPHSYANCYDVLKIRPMQWPALFPPGTPLLAMDLVSRLLVYSPSSRLTAAQVVEHPFFEELFTLDWATLRLLQRTLPLPLDHLSSGSPAHPQRHTFPTDFDDMDKDDEDDVEKTNETTVLNTLFSLAPGEREIYSDNFCSRLSVAYKRLAQCPTSL